MGIQREAAGAVRDELGPGRPLEPGVAARMGPLLGADVSHARVHSDELGARIAERHGAAAVAVGSHVAFARGTYEPGTPLGDALIAHELAHVAQYDETAVVAPAREAEREADAAGVAALAQRGVAALRRSVKSGLALRRCGGKEWPTTPGVFGKAPEKVREGFDRDGNDPGKLPAVSHDKDTSRFSFDADGDQVKELNAEITVMELHASGAAKRVKLVLEQNSSKSRLERGVPAPRRRQGRRPAERRDQRRHRRPAPDEGGARAPRRRRRAAGPARRAIRHGGPASRDADDPSGRPRVAGDRRPGDQLRLPARDGADQRGLHHLRSQP